ncbi:TPA: hypothetical protein ACGF1S_003483 [Vibrio cholerae]
MLKIDYPVGLSFIALVLACFGAGFFFGSSTIGEAISSFVLSIFSSYIFFFLTVTLKERSEKRKIKNIVNPMLGGIVTRLYSAIHNSILNPNETCRPIPDSSKLTDNELDKWLDVDVLNVPIKGFRAHYPQFGVKAQTNIDQLILDSTLPIESMLERIKPYYYMLEHDVVKILTDIENSAHICFSGRALKYENSFVFDKLSFIDFYRLIKRLERYTGAVDGE